MCHVDLRKCDMQPQETFESSGKKFVIHVITLSHKKDRKFKILIPRFKAEKTTQDMLMCIVNIYCIIIYNWKTAIQRAVDALDSCDIISDQFP